MINTSYNSEDLDVSFNSSIDFDEQIDGGDPTLEIQDEKTPLNTTPRMRIRNHTITSSLYQSVTNFTTSNYFGFGSTSYAVAKIKEKSGLLSSKTLSLADIPSFDRKTPTVISLFTQLSIITGLSVFAIPLLVANCGPPMVGGVLAGGILCWYTCLLINKCQYQTSKSGKQKRIYESYIDLGRAAIIWHGDVIMKIMVGSSVFSDVYVLIFCSQVSKDLFHGYLELDARVWMVIWMAVVFPLFFIRRMSILAWLGFMSLILYTIGVLGMFGLLIYHYELWTWTNLVPSKFKLSYVFIGYGIIVNSYNVHLSIPAIEASMEAPESFRKVNTSAFVINTILKISMGIISVISFGIKTEGSVLANFIIYGRAALVLNIIIAIFMIAQYPTSLFVVLEMMDTYALPKFTVFKKDHWTENVWLFLSRLSVTTFIVIVAVCIPNFEMVTGFIGNIRGTLATLVFPIYFYIKLKGRGLSRLSLVLHWLLIVALCCIGLTGAVFATLGMFGHVY